MTSTAPYRSNGTVQKNGLALASLILGIVAITFILNFLLLPSIVGLILGVVGIRRAPLYGRRGMALTGVILSGTALLLGLLVGIVGIAGSLDMRSAASSDQVSQPAQPDQSRSSEPESSLAAEEAPAAVEEPSEEATEEVSAEPAEPELTLSEQNAVESAASYIRSGEFSKKSLIEQLEYEDYTTAESKFAVEYLSPDYDTEADESAESYLNSSSFSRTQLKEQLEYEGFTTSQVEHGLTSVGY